MLITARRIANSFRVSACLCPIRLAIVEGRQPVTLTGRRLLRTEYGRMMSPSLAVKQQRRYRYYVLQVGDARGDLATAPAWRVGAVEIERIICCALTAEIHKRVHERSWQGDLDSGVIARLQNVGKGATAVLDHAPGSEQRALLLALIGRIDVSVAELTIHFQLDAIDALLAEADGLKVRAVFGRSESQGIPMEGIF